MRKIFSFLAQLLFSLLLTLVLIEAGLRLFPSVVPLQLLVYFDGQPRAEIAQRRNLPTKWGTVRIERDDGGPELRIFKPFARVAWPGRESDTIIMDQNGFCNTADSNYAAPAIDLITIGDSFTTCHGVKPQETWTSQLSELTGLPAYNLGRGRAGIHEYIQILKKFGLHKSPQLVIMNIYEGNDLRDAAVYYYYRLNAKAEAETTQSEPEEIDQADVPIMPKLLKNYSYSYNLAQAFWNYLSAATPLALSEGIPAEESESLFQLSVSEIPVHYLAGIDQINFTYRIVFPDNTVQFNKKNTDVDEVLVARHLYNRTVDPGVLESVEEALTTFVDLSKEYNFVPVVTYTPSAHTAYAANVVFEDPALSELMPWFSRYQRDYFKEKGAALGYVFIDVTPALQAAARVRGKDLLYSRIDLHLSGAGHAVVAKAIYQALQNSHVSTIKNLDFQ